MWYGEKGSLSPVTYHTKTQALPVDRHTDTTENTTFPQSTLSGGKDDWWQINGKGISILRKGVLYCITRICTQIVYIMTITIDRIHNYK